MAEMTYLHAKTTISYNRRVARTNNYDEDYGFSYHWCFLGLYCVLFVFKSLSGVPTVFTMYQDRIFV